MNPTIAVSQCVVDASIIMKWFFTEPYSDAARRLVGGKYRILAPDLIYTEIGAILKKRVDASELNDLEATAIVQGLEAMPLQIYHTWSLAPLALDVEKRLQHAVAHCIHLALAIKQDAIFVTADHDFYNFVQDSSLRKHVRWVEQI
jgi:predicted nucleic acid-binding protein